VDVFPAENIRDWRGHDVVDGEDSKIGILEAVYVDTATDQPAFATVKVGLLNRARLIFVPLDGASVSPDHVKVRCDKKLAKEAPSIDPDGELLAQDEPAVFAHYGLSYAADASGRRLARR
jgi:hypothetical protein